MQIAFCTTVRHLHPSLSPLFKVANQNEAKVSKGILSALLMVMISGTRDSGGGKRSEWSDLRAPHQNTRRYSQQWYPTTAQTSTSYVYRVRILFSDESCFRTNEHMLTEQTCEHLVCSLPLAKQTGSRYCRPKLEDVHIFLSCKEHFVQTYDRTHLVSVSNINVEKSNLDGGSSLVIALPRFLFLRRSRLCLVSLLL